MEQAAKVTNFDTAALGEQITELCTYLHAATYRLLVLIREFDECEGWHGIGLVSCAHWLNFKCGIGLNAAREKVRVARALKDLPNISKAFERGEVSYSKARAMTRIADAENEDYLLMISEHGTAHHVETLVRKYRAAKRVQDALYDEEIQRDRYLDYRYDEDGCLVIKGRIPAEKAALLAKAIDRVADELFETELKEDPEAMKHRSAPARRADGLAIVAETYLANPDVSGTSADRYQVVVHVEANTGEAHIEDGPHVTAETSKRLACDCSLIKVTDDENGQPLSIGRKTRSIPPAIRRALRFRDEGCRFPGCTHTRFVDGHHIQHWADGGETSLDNLVMLCRHHHRLVHEGGFHCERTIDGEVVFKAPNEQRLHDYSPPRAIDEDAFEWFENEIRKDEVGTCAAQWYAGDTMDWHHAVGLLFPSPSR